MNLAHTHPPRFDRLLARRALAGAIAVSLLAAPQTGAAARGRTPSLAPSAAAVISGPGTWHVLDSATPAAERPAILAGSRSLWCGRFDPCWVDTVGYTNFDYEILYIDTGTHTTDYTLTLLLSLSTERLYDWVYLVGGGAGSVDPIGDNDVIMDEVINTGTGTTERLLVSWTGSIQSNTHGAKSIDTTGGPVVIDGSDNAEPDVISTSIQIAAGHRALYFVMRSDDLFSSADGGWQLGSGTVFDNLATSDHGSIYADATPAGGVDAFGGAVLVGTPAAPLVSSRRGPKPFGQSPVITAPANTTRSEGGSVSLTATASDPDAADAVTLSAFGYPVGLSFTQTSGNPASATVSGTLAVGSAAGSPYRIRWCANSGDLVGTTSTLVVQVGSDLAPVVTAPASVTRTELSYIVIDVSAVDPDGQPINALTASFSSLPPGHNAVFQTGAANTSGVMTWTPGAGHTGTFPVPFTATNALSGSATTMIQVTPVTTAATAEGGALRAPALDQNQPNPFNPSTVIPYHVPREGPVALRIYDAQARLVATLVERSLTPGDYLATWDGRDRRGRAAPSGVYTCRLEAAGAALSRRMVLLR